MEKLLSCVMDIGEQMLLCGAEVHRVEESIRLMCSAIGAKRIDVFIITSSMVVTVSDNDDKLYTQTKRINCIGTDFEKLHRLNTLSRKICAQPMTADQIHTELDKATHCKRYPFWLVLISYCTITGSFSLFFGGTWIDAVVSVIVGGTVCLLTRFSDKTISNKIFSKFIAAVAATALTFTALKMGIIRDVDKVIIGNIMTLIPGIGLTNSLRDLFTGDSIAGLFRSLEAVLVALAIAAGYFVVAFLGGAIL